MGFAKFKILLMLAWRNLFSHKGKNAIVGVIIMFGTFLVVLGTSLLDSIEHSMTRSVTASVAGHLQIYDQNARDDLALFGSGFMGRSDIGSIPDFARVKKALLQVPNVKAVVPMGIDAAEFYSSTQMDETIEALRKAQMAGNTERVAAHSGKIRSMAALMEEEFKNRLKILSNTEEVEQQIADIQQVQTDAFWEDFAGKPHQVVEFLDTKIAPLVDENDQAFLRYLGTDLHLFAENFDTFEMVSGKMVPPGTRGLLVNQRFYDRVLRNRVARELDDLHDEVFRKSKKIAKDPLLQNQVDRMARQHRRITFQLEPAQARELKEKLQKMMPEACPQGSCNLAELVTGFLKVNDENLKERHTFFFKTIAPMIRLYLFDIGDVITIRAYTKSGYIKSVNVRVFGTFTFKGLETSALAGAFSLMDIITFRDLYGMMTKEKREELRSIREQVGIQDIQAGEAEDALFGEETQIEVKAEKDKGFDEFADVDLSREKINGKIVHDTTYDQEAIDQGIALNAAVILDDLKKLKQTQAAVSRLSGKEQLGIQVVDWMTASGMVGQMVVLVRVVLYVAIFIIFMVALVIINNTMVMATMERTIEVGTIRAMGGQSRFVLALFMLETMLLGLIAGTLGALIGAGVVKKLGQVGIPAIKDVLVFLFSGPRLYPTVGANHLITAGVVIVVVSLIATFYPAFLATRIQPHVAMQARE